MKVIGFLSGKGGVGKTTSALNTAAALHSYGVSTFLVDGNFTTPNIGIHLGLPAPRSSIHDVLKGKKEIHESVHNHASGLRFIPGSLSVDDMEGLKLSRLKALRDLKAHFIIVDGAAGLGNEAVSLMEHCDELIIVSCPELPALTDGLKTIKLAEIFGKKVKGVLITRVKGDRHEISLKNIEHLLETPVIGVIPEDETVQEALYMKDAIVFTHPHSNAGRAYRRFAANLCGRSFYEEDPKPSLYRKFLSLFKSKAK